MATTTSKHRRSLKTTAGFTPKAKKFASSNPFLVGGIICAFLFAVSATFIQNPRWILLFFFLASFICFLVHFEKAKVFGEWLGTQMMRGGTFLFKQGVKLLGFCFVFLGKLLSNHYGFWPCFFGWLVGVVVVGSYSPEGKVKEAMVITCVALVILGFYKGYAKFNKK